MIIKLRKPYMGVHEVTSEFGRYDSLYKRLTGRPHNGVDFDLKHGEPVMAAAPGKIVVAGWGDDGFGQRVYMEHKGFWTLYAHLDHAIRNVNDQVKEREVIAYSGGTGKCVGDHLHFGLRVAGIKNPQTYDFVDPLPYIVDFQEVKLCTCPFCGKEFQLDI